MKKTAPCNKGQVQPLTTQQCKLYQQIRQFTGQLDRLPDAQEARNNPLRSAPPGMVPMVF